MTRIFSILIAVLFLLVGHTASAQGLLDRALALMGNADAQYALGNAYRNGKGVEQDYVEAVSWYRLAAEQGHAFAQFALGLAYNYGEGVEKDYATAAKWYRPAAEQGLYYAQYFLGCAYRNGEGVEQDFVETVKWLQIAAEQTDEDAEQLAEECVRK